MNVGDLAKCRWFGKDIMVAKYNGRLSWCHVRIQGARRRARVRCEEPALTAEPAPPSLAEALEEK